MAMESETNRLNVLGQKIAEAQAKPKQRDVWEFGNNLLKELFGGAGKKNNK